MTYFADRASHARVKIVSQSRLAKDTMHICIDAPALAAQAVPGQFFMLRIAGSNDPLIGRALALFGREQGLELVYLVKGKFTTRLSRMAAGEQVEVIGPLGNGFSNRPVEHLIMVAGGIGQTPFLALAKEALGQASYGQPVRANGYAQRVSFCYGVRTAEYLAGLPMFERSGVALHIATEDGSHGPPQRVTAPLEQLLRNASATQSTRVAMCGPEPMMAAVSHLAQQYGVDCEVSLETPMACGIGICFTCVAKIGTEEDWDYKRTCVEGPVFSAQEIVW